MLKTFLKRMVLPGMALALVAGAAHADPKKGGTLTIVPEQVTSFTKNFNPLVGTGRRMTSRDFLYEPLVIYNYIQDSKPEYRLAEGLEYSSDLKTITYRIRKGVKWSDGETLDANDVLFTFNLLKQYPALDERGLFKGVLNDVRKIDDYTLAVELSSVDSQAQYSIGQLYTVPEHVWKDVADPVSYTNEKPVGSGPFTEITRFTPQVYEQCRNPNYWQAGKPHIDCLKVPQYADNDQVLAAAFTGKVDWLGSFIPSIEDVYVSQNPKHHKYWFPPSGTVAFYLNTRLKPASDINFRRAFSMAMNREIFIEIAGYGYPTPNQYPSGLGHGFKDWNNQAVDKAHGKYMNYDPAAAKKILTDAGYKDVDGDGFLENPDGSKISLTSIVPSGWTDWISSTQLAVEGLAEIGIQAKVSTPESVVWRRKLRSGDFEMSINSHRTHPSPWGFFEAALHSRHQTIKENNGEVGDTANRFAAHRFITKEADGLLDAFVKTIDRAEQQKIVDRLQEIVAENMVYTTVFSNPSWYEYNDSRFVGWASAENPFVRPMVYAGVPERLLHVLNLSKR